MRAQNASLCRDELRAVSIGEIEVAERALMEGCDYRLRCHHPFGAIKVLAADMGSYLLSTTEEKAPMGYEAGFNAATFYGHDESPRSVVYGYQPDQQYHIDNNANTLCERALSIAQSALVYSDANFLFPPGQIAFAALTLALDGHQAGCNNFVGPRMREYLRLTFRNKSTTELTEFEGEVGKIITHLDQCPEIDLNKFSPYWHYRDGRAAEIQARETRRVFHVAARCRVMKGATFQVIDHSHSLSPQPSSVLSPVGDYYHHYSHQHHLQHHQHPYFEGGGRKRGREKGNQWTPHHQSHYYKVARVTPITTPFL